MVATGNYLWPEFAIVSNRLTLYRNKRITVKKLYLADKHQGPVVPVILIEPWSEVGDPELSIIGNKFCCENVCILHVRLVCVKVRHRGLDGKLTPFLRIEQ